jgi:L-lactate dehydrogenase
VKIGIIGTGNVGATTAYALLMQGIGREIVLVDQNKERAAAEAADLLHAVPFAHALRVRAGDYADLAGSRVVIITAGVGQRPGETRLQLLERNAAIMRDIVCNTLAHAHEAILVIASNPVDIMTHLAARFARDCGVAPRHVLGSGTTLDTARFRALLSEQIGVDSTHIHAYVVGEHGDSEVLAWSMVNVGNLPLDTFCGLQGFEVTPEMRARIDHEVRDAAYAIIQGKGATFYGIGAALARTVNVILRDQRSILTVCSPMESIAGVEDVTLSLPRLIGGNGVLATFDLPLSDGESAALHRSAGVIHEAIESLDPA